ncbi:MAG: ATP-binding protein [Muribaculaceae bacterium]|nr:ATP-binding protein [Muribaculaceae bacterium]
MKEIPTKMEGYAIGEQDFRNLRMDGAIYVDKTKYLEKIVKSKGKYYFLARPRRFGKSLFLSTIRYFFEGRKELFRGLAIDSADWHWQEYPVLLLDFNTGQYSEVDGLEPVLRNLLKNWEGKYDVKDIDDDYSQRLRNIIAAAHEKTGLPVVILVDEYDKPLVRNLNEQKKFEHYRSLLASLYSNFKSAGEHIKLVFLTGVSRFSKLSVFSDLNNIDDITFDNEYADICGITENELLKYFKDGIRALAEETGISYQKALKRLKFNYDGYRFAAKGSEIYNPWSVLNAMRKSAIKNYWNETGLPTIVAETLKKINVNLEATFNSKITEDDLKGLDLLNPNPTALLYQTGYLTIKRYYSGTDQYLLGIPNLEVRKGLFKVLLPYYVVGKEGTANQNLLEMVSDLMDGNPDHAMLRLQAFFAGIDYKLKMENENNFHNAFYLLTHIIGLNTKTEVHTSDGSIDLLIETEHFLYIIELKYDHTADEALRQIEEKKYGRVWQTDIREVFLIGVEFSSKTRCIEDWKIRKLKE